MGGVTWQVFWFLTYFVDPLFVAATSFISRDVATRPRHASRMALLLIIMSAILGVGLGLVSFATPVFATHIFTTDAAVTAMFMKVAPFMGAGQVLASIVLVAEGVLIGANPNPTLPSTFTPQPCPPFASRRRRPSPRVLILWCLFVRVVCCWPQTCPTLLQHCWGFLADTPCLLFLARSLNACI